jgi:hypothetical protein
VAKQRQEFWEKEKQLTNSTDEIYEDFTDNTWEFISLHDLVAKPMKSLPRASF